MEFVLKISTVISGFHSCIIGHKAKNPASIFKREKARGSLRAHGLFTSVGRADRMLSGITNGFCL